MTDAVPTGNSPHAIGINSVTDRIYLANADDGTLTVIDGATHSTATIAVGNNPQAVAVNPATNKIYVANTNPSGTVTVIDGVSNAATTVADAEAEGSDPEGNTGRVVDTDRHAHIGLAYQHRVSKAQRELAEDTRGASRGHEGCAPPPARTSPIV